MVKLKTSNNCRVPILMINPSYPHDIQLNHDNPQEEYYIQHDTILRCAKL